MNNWLVILIWSGAIVAALVEAICPAGLDNLAVPAATTALLPLFGIVVGMAHGR